MQIVRAILGLGLLLVLGGLSFLSPSLAVSVEAQSGTPQVLQTIVPSDIPASETAYGAVRFQDPQADVTHAEIHVIDGKFNPFHERLTANRVELTRQRDVPTGMLIFPLDCTMAEQRVTLMLELVDRQGHRSSPTHFSFTCGNPHVSNFGAEQAEARPVNHRLTMNLFVLDDGVNTLAHGAVFPKADAAIGQPRERLREAIREQIVPAITGIWDQCGVGVRLGRFGIVRPGQVSLSQGSLEEQLFVQEGHLPEIALANDPLRVISEAHDRLSQRLEPQGRPLGADELTVFVSSARLVARPGATQQFGGLTYLKGRISFVRWDAVFHQTDPSESIVLPKRAVTAMAHEFGHNFGLGHVSEPADRQNLMFADPDGRAVHVPPQPPVGLTSSQCDRAVDHIRDAGLGSGQ